MVKRFFASLFATCSLILAGILFFGYLLFTWRDILPMPTELYLLMLGLLFDTVIMGIPLAIASLIIVYPHPTAYWALKLHLLFLFASPVFAAAYLILNR